MSKFRGVPVNPLVMDVIAVARAVMLTASQRSELTVGVAEEVMVVTRAGMESESTGLGVAHALPV
jgi:hypothetical protein